MGQDENHVVFMVCVCPLSSTVQQISTCQIHPPSVGSTTLELACLCLLFEYPMSGNLYSSSPSHRRVLLRFSPFIVHTNNLAVFEDRLKFVTHAQAKINTSEGFYSFRVI